MIYILLVCLILNEFQAFRNADLDADVNADADAYADADTDTDEDGIF